MRKKNFPFFKRGGIGHSWMGKSFSLFLKGMGDKKFVPCLKRRREKSFPFFKNGGSGRKSVSLFLKGVSWHSWMIKSFFPFFKGGVGTHELKKGFYGRSVVGACATVSQLVLQPGGSSLHAWKMKFGQVVIISSVKIKYTLVFPILPLTHYFPVGFKVDVI